MLIGSKSFIEKFKNELKPSIFVLYQNYPNTFNPNTFIRFAIPVESRVKITIYNCLGELITNLIDDVMKEGNYELGWYAKNFSSGSYLYRIEAIPLNSSKQFTQVNKMTLIK